MIVEKQDVITIDDIDDKKKIYMKNNNLIKSKYDITAAENKLYMFLSDKVKRSSDAQNSEYAKLRFDRSELFDLFKGQLREPTRIQKVFSKLLKRSIFIYEKKANGKERWGEYAFLSSYKYDQETDTFTVVMNSEISELIVEHYLSGYTPMNLDVIYNLNSIYAQRLYELIRLWSWTGSKITYSISDLKAYLMLDNKKSYNNFSNFNKKVIEPAVNELNKSGLLKISYKPIKKGRSVASIEFIVEDLDNRVYFKKDEVEEKVVKTIESKDVVFKDKNKDQNEPKKEFYIPDRDAFTPAVARRIEREFSEYDFSFELHEEVFNDAIMITMDKDNVDKIKYNSYPLFKKILKTRLDNTDFKRGFENAQQSFFNDDNK